MQKHKVISSDDHIFEPLDLWTTRLDKKFRDRAPRVIPHEDGDWWYCEGIKVQTAAAAAQAGLRFDDPDRLSFQDKVENIRPGAYIPEEHIKDMDADGIDMGLVYPTVGLQLYQRIQDSELLTALFRTYNDWLAEFCDTYPDRLRGIAMINLDDIPSGIKEMEHCAKLGHRGIMITIEPLRGRSYDRPEYEPVWAAAQDLALPISLHVTTNRPDPDDPGALLLDAAKPSFFVNLDHWPRVCLTDMIFSGVFERYPKLQVGSVEMELSWVPHFLDRLDYNYTQRAREIAGERFKEDIMPSEFFHRHVFLSFQEDQMGIRDREIIGVDSLLWGSDYPHFESTFPKSQEFLGDMLADCTEEEWAKIVGGNAARVYQLG